MSRRWKGKGSMNSKEETDKLSVPSWSSEDKHHGRCCEVFTDCIACLCPVTSTVCGHEAN